MPEIFSAAEVETLARERGLTVAQLCAGAQVAHSTFTRWRAGSTEPNLAVYRRFLAVIRNTSAAKKDATQPAAVA